MLFNRYLEKQRQRRELERKQFIATMFSAYHRKVKGENMEIYYRCIKESLSYDYKKM